MSRQLKFRTWDSWWGKMHYFDFTKNIEATPDDELKGLWILHEEGSVYAIQDKIKIMQFTGLYDKNEAEIYEGDIVRFANGKIRTVFKVKGGFAIESLDMDVGRHGKISYCPIESLADEQNAGYIESQAEVIGNIYDNPELLESEG